MGSSMSISLLRRRNSRNRQGIRGRGESVAAVQPSSANQSDNEAEVRLDGHDQSYVTLKNSIQAVILQLANDDESPMCMPEQALNAYLKDLDIVISSLKEKWIPYELRRKGQGALDKATSRLASEVHDSDYWNTSQIRKFIQELRRPQHGDVSFRDRCVVPSSENSSDSGSRSSNGSSTDVAGLGWDEPPCGSTDNSDKSLCRTSVLLLAGCDTISVVFSDSIVRLKQIVQRFVDADHHHKLSSLPDEHRQKLLRCFDSHDDPWLTEKSMASFGSSKDVSEASLSGWIHAFKVAVRVLQAMRKQFFQPGDDGELYTLKQTYFTVVAQSPVQRFLSTARALTNVEWPADKISPMLLLMEAFDDMLPTHLPDLLPSRSAEMQLILKKMEGIVGSIFDKMKIYVKNLSSHGPDADGTQEAAEDDGIHSSTKFVVKCMRLLSVHSTTVHRIFSAPEDDVNSLANQLTGVFDVWNVSLEEHYRSGAAEADRPAFRLISLLNNVDWVSRNGEIAEEGLLVNGHLLKRHRENNERRIQELIDGYLENCWKPHVSCLTDRGVRLTAKARATILRRFNSGISATLQTQAAWKVPDPKLRRKIRQAIADLVIGPYKDFLGQSDGDAEELEEKIYELFQGHVN